MKRAQSFKEERIPVQSFSSRKPVESCPFESTDYFNSNLGTLPCLSEKKVSVVFKELREVFTADDYDHKMDQVKKERERSKSIPTRFRRMSSDLIENVLDYFAEMK
ncbi:hypothetical protein HDV01_004811 [Terramyces sp. JEL0728]|nr:hypothetical protein HDV01_001135 [Terramyces sp. JEL0728]KAJ3273034.1 hypothetical protein HDV01_004811 [Terramyces sp. JEL0728]